MKWLRFRRFPHKDIALKVSRIAALLLRPRRLPGRRNCYLPYRLHVKRWRGRPVLTQTAQMSNPLILRLFLMTGADPNWRV